MCLVAVNDSEDGEHVVASPPELNMVVPEIMDDVKVVSGPFRHKTGQLVDITDEGQHGVVVFDDENRMRVVQMGRIGKLAYFREPFRNDDSSRSHSSSRRLKVHGSRSESTGIELNTSEDDSEGELSKRN